MDSNLNFILHGIIDVTHILDILNEKNLDWDEYTDRQKRFNTEHQHTKTIPILFDKSMNFNHFKKMPTDKYVFFVNELTKIESVIRESTKENGKIFRALLVKLQSKKSIRPHIDIAGTSLVLGRRIHIPVITNEECFFTVGEERKILKMGEVWEINNDKKKHSVENNGNSDRVHLIVDWVEDSILQKYDFQKK